MLIHSLSKYLVICFSVSRIELVTRDRVREGWEGYSPCLFGLQSWFKSTSQQRLNYPTATAASPRGGDGHCGFYKLLQGVHKLHLMESLYLFYEVAWLACCLVIDYCVTNILELSGLK